MGEGWTRDAECVSRGWDNLSASAITPLYLTAEMGLASFAFGVMSPNSVLLLIYTPYGSKGADFSNPDYGSDQQ
jgi:hypothetical protein